MERLLSRFLWTNGNEDRHLVCQQSWGVLGFLIQILGSLLASGPGRVEATPGQTGAAPRATGGGSLAESPERARATRHQAKTTVPCLLLALPKVVMKIQADEGGTKTMKSYATLGYEPNCFHTL